MVLGPLDASHGSVRALPDTIVVVTIPGVGGNAGTPTGQIFNGSANFNGDLFIFSGEDGR